MITLFLYLAVWGGTAVAGVFPGQSIERLPATCDSNTAADWQRRREPTLGIVTLNGDCASEPALTETLPPIGEIQGGDDVAAYVNQKVSFRGVVTGFFEDRNASGQVFYTLFVQDLPGIEDGDPATSDAVAVFAGRKRPTLQIGDQVRVSGRVTEFFGFTEIDDDDLDIQVEANGVSLPEPVPLDPPDTAERRATYYEALEGMRVAVEGTAPVVGPTFRTCAFAVTPEDAARVFRRSADDTDGRLIPVLYETELDCAGFPDVKTGDRVVGLVGPLIYHFDEFKIVAQGADTLSVTPAPLPEPPTPPNAGDGQFSVASFNLENHFDSTDDTGDAAEPKPSPTEIATKQTKLAYAITRVLACPTVIGVQEVENAALLETLATETAVGCGFTYDVTHRESADGRGIDVALLSDPRRVTVVEASLAQTCAPLDTGVVDDSVHCALQEDPLFSRPPLVATLRIDGQPVAVIVNHFKSKRGGAAETAARRRRQAQHINALVAEWLAQDAGARIVVLGDFNDYEASPPLLAMTEQGRLTNVLRRVADEQRYSFIFGGAAQLIDGLLVSPALAETVVDVTIVHVNADYPFSWAGETDPERIVYRSSDHDLPLAVFDLADVVDVVPSPSPFVQETAVPSASNSSRLWWWGSVLVVTAVLFLIAWQWRQS